MWQGDGTVTLDWVISGGSLTVGLGAVLVAIHVLSVKLLYSRYRRRSEGSEEPSAIARQYVDYGSFVSQGCTTRAALVLLGLGLTIFGCGMLVVYDVVP